MLRFLARRLLHGLLVLWFVVSVTFTITYLLPADPAKAIVGPHGSPETVLRVRKELCLDRSFREQYGCYVGRILRFDLGKSFRVNQPVVTILGTKVWATAQLALAAILIQVLFGVPIGVYAALKRNRAGDYVVSILALLGQSAPTFFLGPLFMYFLAHRSGLFPISGYGAPGLDRLHHLILPATTLATAGIAYYARLVRGEMIEVLSDDYVRTARAKGVAAWKVTTKHALRNALSPVVTLIGLDLGVLMGGAIVTEFIFSWPGIGREAVQSILQIDLPVILGVVLLAAIAILVANLLTDLAYALLDPRVRLS
jgi:peptide/nickel transport system permease protein